MKKSALIIELGWESSVGYSGLPNPLIIDFNKSVEVQQFFAEIYACLGDGRIAKLWCTACKGQPGGGRLCLRCLTAAGNPPTDQYVCARWPRSDHVCERFGGRPKVDAIELTSASFNALVDAAVAPDGLFRLDLSRNTYVKRQKPEAFVTAVVRRWQRATPAPISRRLSGALITLFEMAGLNVWQEPRGFKQFWGIADKLHEAYRNSDELGKSLGCQIIFPEVDFARVAENGGRDRIIREAMEKSKSARFPNGRVVIVGRLRSRAFIHSHEVVKITKMMDCDIVITPKVWNKAVCSFGKPVIYQEGQVHQLESFCACVIEMKADKLVTKHITWVTVDYEGVPFFESGYELPFARACYERKITFVKPCHVRFRIGDSNIWPDFLLQSIKGLLLIVEVDPGGSRKSMEKIAKSALMDRNDIIHISFDPKRQCSADLPMWQKYFQSRTTQTDF